VALLAAAAEIRCPGAAAARFPAPGRGRLPARAGRPRHHTAQARSAPGERATTAFWLKDTAGITAIKIESVQHFTASPPCYVCAEFRYSSHPWTGHDSFPDGEHHWCYDLVHRHCRWLIYDDGLG
jgi:hypothetical protein